ncbi:MAG TPA: DAHL domain-containing protein [Polyangiales bacterium]|nr:DAHL domain-containing protein [Polyangiales bacterium]
MNARVLVALAVLLSALAAGLAWLELHSARALSSSMDDVARLDALLAGRAALQTSVLSARAGLELSFDEINHALSFMRRTYSEEPVVRARGAAYSKAADELARTGAALRVEETALETFKTDLALLRLSSRYFPLAADALMSRWTPRARRSKPESDNVREATALAAIDSLRTEVERYQEAPTGQIAQRLESMIPRLEALRSPESGDAESADLSALLGHTRMILDRRERVDRFTRNLVQSPVRVHLEAARAAYDQATRAQLKTVVVLRIVASELAALGIIALAVVVWQAVRQRRSSAATK